MSSVLVWACLSHITEFANVDGAVFIENELPLLIVYRWCYDFGMFLLLLILP